MADKNFPTDFNNRGTVKGTDVLLIHNIDTGLTELTTVADLIASIESFVGLILTGNTKIDAASVANELLFSVRTGYTGNNNIVSIQQINSDAYMTLGSAAGVDNIILDGSNGNITSSGVIAADTSDSDDWKEVVNKQNAITGGEAAPSGGVNGDIYFQYEPLV